jgi:hypothetical protein
MWQASRSSGSRSTWRLVPATMAALIAVAACSSSNPTATPRSSAASATVSLAPATTAPATPTPAATPEPTATPAPTAPPGPFDLAWVRAADPATGKLGDWEQMFRPTWTRFGAGLLMAIDSQGGDAGPQIWRSDDGLRWQSQTLPVGPGDSVSAEAVTVGGPGLVALGEVTGADDETVTTYWTSADGTAWTRTTSPGLTDGQLWLLWETGARRAWWDESGVDVTVYQGPAVTDPGLQRVVVAGGVLTAFVGDSDANPTGKPVRLMQATGPGDLTDVGQLPSSNGASVEVAAQGPAGWIAFGCNASCNRSRAWTSADGLTWTTAKAWPVDSVNALLADQAGFIVAGERVTGAGCAVGQGDIQGETWTSSTGARWRLMPDQPDFKRASIQVLLPIDRTLIGLGQTWPKRGAPTSTAWTFELPFATSDAAVTTTPAPTETSAPAGEGCG